MDKIRIVIPVYNDWRSFRILLRELDRAVERIPARVFVTAVNDGSTEELASISRILPF